MIVAVAVLAVGLAALPAIMYLNNRRHFRPPPGPPDDGPVPRVSVLIPARNEAAAIGPAVASILASTGVEFELVVLDDHSTDGTADAVRKAADGDPRVRVESAPPLPDGWCGKQFACLSLARLAKYDVLAFLDADVRLAPDGLARLAHFQRTSGAALVSGFPRQETGTLAEKSVIPLINWLVMGYLPVAVMRRLPHPALGTGCGQWFLTTRDGYEAAGTHAAVKHSLHDGVTLPRAYRRAGLTTDICDATDLAVCRMYRSAGQVWYGLAKNAREGLAAWPLILVWTALLFGGHVLPWLLLMLGPDLVFHGAVAKLLSDDPSAWHDAGVAVTALAATACGLSLAPRLAAAGRFKASWLGAALHPVGVSVLLAIQWYATARHLVGRPVGWKGRPHPSLSSATQAPS